MKQLIQRLNLFLRSKLFFHIVIGFFVFEALWFVFSAVYPQAFDEDFHFGLIQLYAHHWSPFLASQPPNADQFGAVARDPSYLYHYLMSFPYRFIELFTHNQTTQIIILRLLNVAMFTSGLVLFSKVMARAKASQALINVAFVIFSLIPVVPQLAAHINYDNLLMLLLPLFCLVSFSIIDALRQRRIPVKMVLYFMALSFFMSLVKYPALPFVAAAVMFLLVVLHVNFRHHYRELWPAISENIRTIRWRVLVPLVGAVLLGAVMFTQRYGVNLVEYKNPIPNCQQVLTVEQCSQYGPWNRNAIDEAQKPASFKPKAYTYMASWLDGMWQRLFFAITGPDNDYTNFPGLPLPSITAVAIAVVGFVMTLLYWKPVFKDNLLLVFLMSISFLYVAALWLDDFMEYGATGQPVAINGRYLLPVLLLIAVAMGRAFSVALRKKPETKAILAVLAILLFLNGGGVATFILRSDPSWDWPNSVVTRTNDAARTALTHVTVTHVSLPKKP